MKPTFITTKPTKKHVLIGISAVVFFGILFFGYRYINEWRYLISTDDAYIQGDITTIAPKVSGYIKEVNIKANQEVKQNDILFTLDDGDYRLALADVNAKIETQNRTLDRINAQVNAARSNYIEAEASRDAATAVKINAEQTLTRAQTLQQSQSVSQSIVDAAQSALDQAVANVTRANAQIAAAQANIMVLHAQYKEAESVTRSLQVAQEKAKRDLNFTIIRAPIDGIIGNLASQKGDLVVNGQQLAALVPNRFLYVDANYKETQIAKIYVGEKAYVTIDGVDGKGFEGRVLSLSPASGAVFSILPPQNATGNFTKIVQRIPVRISIPDEVLKTGRIRAGMSVRATIDTRTAPQAATVQ